MVDWLDKKISIKLMVWLTLLVFVIHDSEEILTMEKWAADNISRLPDFIKDAAQINTAQFAMAVLLLFVIGLLVAGLTTRYGVESTYFKAYIFVAVLLLVNAITHVLQAVVFRGYIPGVVTTIIPLLPFTVYAVFRLIREGYLSTGMLMKLSAIAFILQGVLTVGAKILGKLIV
ncbi:MAG: HXXEE domain-containing protein [Clostridia bacterium]|nr:HXXEE domain-containing protein [Clostridia bacterium]